MYTNAIWITCLGGGRGGVGGRSARACAANKRYVSRIGINKEISEIFATIIMKFCRNYVPFRRIYLSDILFTEARKLSIFLETSSIPFLKKLICEGEISVITVGIKKRSVYRTLLSVFGVI